MDVILDDGGVVLMRPATIEGPALPAFRWLVSSRSDADRVLQQAVQMQCGSKYWHEWRDVPEVQADDSA